MSTYDQYRLTSRGRRLKSEFGAGAEDEGQDPAMYTILDMIDSGASLKIPPSLMRVVHLMLKLGLIVRSKL